MKRLVIYTQSGVVIKIDNFTNLNYNSNTLYFEQVGFAGDKGKCFFRNIAGYVIFEKE